jgi:ribulose-5-phosphate 4-epimerase/fuculose-1-phosphate aldolase
LRLFFKKEALSRFERRFLMDGTTAVAASEQQLRIDLAAAFRLAAKFDWHEAVANHLSLAVSADGKMFLLNPLWRHFSTIRASDLVLLDATGETPAAIDKTAWMIHGTMHAHLPQARCILHLHPPYATALSCLADASVKPIEQTTARWFRRLAIDTEYGGMADNAEEGLRLTRALGGHNAMMMGNHGVLTTGATVAEAFDAMYHLERACRTMVLAYSTGQALRVLSDEIAEKTAAAWEDEGRFARAHFAEMKRILDREDGSYAE